LNECWGHQQRGDGKRKARKKMLLLHVVLLLVVVMGWSYQTPLACMTRRVSLLLPNSEKIKHITIAI
jgi:hypothetical protein